MAAGQVDAGVEPMLIWTPAALSVSIHSPQVNWDPWSVLKIPGLPYFPSASCSASTQKSGVIVFDTRQDRVLRLPTSMMATRYWNPCAIGREVRSAGQTRLG